MARLLEIKDLNRGLIKEETETKDDNEEESEDRNPCSAVDPMKQKHHYSRADEMKMTGDRFISLEQ